MKTICPCCGMPLEPVEKRRGTWLCNSCVEALIRGAFCHNDMGVLIAKDEQSEDDEL